MEIDDILRKEQNNTRVKLSVGAQKALFADVCQRYDIEACGLLLGSMDEMGNWLIEQAQPLRNIFSSSVYFEFAPEDLLSAELAYPDRIMGVYHSHPTGFPRASGTDRENMQRVNQEEEIPWIWLIIRGPFDSKFGQSAQGCLPATSMIAYYHSSEEGLQQIAIEPEEVTEKAGQAT